MTQFCSILVYRLADTNVSRQVIWATANCAEFVFMSYLKFRRYELTQTLNCYESSDFCHPFIYVILHNTYLIATWCFIVHAILPEKSQLWPALVICRYIIVYIYMNNFIKTIQFVLLCAILIKWLNIYMPLGSLDAICFKMRIPPAVDSRY